MMQIPFYKIHPEERVRLVLKVRKTYSHSFELCIWKLLNIKIDEYGPRPVTRIYLYGLN